jgi:hypothetical protein
MNEPPRPDRQVAGRKLMTEMMAVRRDVSSVLTKVEVMTATQAHASAQMNDIEARLRLLQAAVPDQLGQRLTAVERWQWRTGGALAAIAVIAGTLGGFLGTLIAHVH